MKPSELADHRGRYILDADGNPQPEPNLVKWAKWYGKYKRQIAQDYVGKVHISTIFLALDQSFPFFSPQRPILWETMIFDADHGEHDCYIQRYTSLEDALAGHKKAVEMVKNTNQRRTDAHPDQAAR